MPRLIDHLVAAIERHSSQKLSPHPDIIQIKRHGEIRQTCETYWRTKQNMQDRSADHGDAPQHFTMTFMPDTLTTSPAGPNITDQT